MKKIISLILIVTVFFSCITKTDNSKLNKGEIIKEENIIQENNISVSSSEHKKGEPIEILQNFLKDIEKLGWIYDTVRVKEHHFYALKNKNIAIFNNLVFYKLTFEDTYLSDLYKKRNETIVIYSDDDSTSVDTNKTRTQLVFEKLDIDLFKKVNNIWVYYYRKKGDKEFISDGVIEQWQFDNNEQATKALEQIKKVSIVLYTNTMPFYTVKDETLIIFNTRAMMFSYDQKELFKIFINDYLKLTKN